MTWLINWLLTHTGKRWQEEQEHTIRIMMQGDKMIGQLNARN